MSTHTTHTMHQNSLDAFASLNLNKRCTDIIKALGILKIATDRQIAEWLDFHDMNAIRPRVSEMIGRRVLREVGKQPDHVSGKMVRLVELSP